MHTHTNTHTHTHTQTHAHTHTHTHTHRSMLPDVIDEAYLKTGVRREELFYAFFVFGTKFAGGVTLGISTGIYK